VIDTTTGAVFGAQAGPAAIQGGLLLTQARRDPERLRDARDGTRAVLAGAGA
jgi:hypothetical protein